jgi:capsule polysaccharide export protein KpsE/RkpR
VVTFERGYKIIVTSNRRIEKGEEVGSFSFQLKISTYAMNGVFIVITIFFSLFSSFVSTTSMTVWTANTKSPVTVEQQTAGNGSTEKNLK